MRYIYKTKPRKYQVDALKFLVKKDGVGALLCDPGTGKTKMVIDYLGVETSKRGSLKVLVAAPLSALDTWATEIDLHLGTLDGHEIPTRVYVLSEGTILEKAEFLRNLEDTPGLTVVVINHDAFKYKHKVPGLKTVTVRDRIIDAVNNKWMPDVLVVDEMHRLKTHNSNLSTAFKKMGQMAFHRIGLTGTVAPHSPLDFFGQWQFINPITFGTRWDSFRYYYAIYGGWEGKQVLGFYSDKIKEMKEKVKLDSFIIRKHEVLDLPPVTDVVVPVRLGKEMPYYLEMGKEFMVDLPSGAQSISPNTLTKMLRLRQITGGVVGYKNVVTDEKTGRVKEVPRTEDIGDSKLKVMIDKVESIYHSGEKQVIFAHFRRDVQRIFEACTKQFDCPVYMITGATSGKKREEQRKEFYHHEGPAIFVAQMRTVSLAINEFVVASYGHFYSYSQLRDDFDQARDRLDRSGQTKPVTFYHYIVPHSIDEVILESHRQKSKLEAAVTKRAKEILTLQET